MPRGFTLVELLVAVAVFAAMAALAYGGLAGVVRTRTELAQAQDDFRSLTRSVGLLERDLREAASRPVRDNNGRPLAAFVGASDRVEFTRLGFANPQAEARSNLERVLYQLDGDTLERGNFAVLDRAPQTVPQIAKLRANTSALRLRYLDPQRGWVDRWPRTDMDNPLQALPRAVEFRIETKDYGEVLRIVELTATWPAFTVTP
ncbi:MAG TPA: type II secretion system minor pseudopilin GspJ [Rudaea sp.]